jgi:hypothetical protein
VLASKWENGMGEKRNAYRLLVGKPQRKRPLGIPRCRWVDNIRMDLEEVGWGDVDWVGLARDRDKWRALVNTVMNLENYRVASQLAASRVSQFTGYLQRAPCRGRLIEDIGCPLCLCFKQAVFSSEC